MPELTIIITIYRVKEYLKKCLNSIKAQSYQNFQAFMIVGQGDKECECICRRYEKVDERFHLVMAEPRGLSDARNVGLNLTDTEYVTFIDGDDYLDRHACAMLMHKIVKYNCDIAVGNYKIYKDGRINLPPGKYDSGIYSGEEALKFFLCGHDIQFVTAWGKIYRTNLFKNYSIQYPVGKMHEDNLTTYKLLYHASKVAYVNKTVYYYVDRSTSLSYNTNLKKERVIVDSITEVRQYIGNKKEIKTYIDTYEISIYISYLLRICKSEDKKSFDLYLKYLKRIRELGVLHNKVIRMRLKIFYICLIVFTKTMYVILKKI